MKGSVPSIRYFVANTLYVAINGVLRILVGSPTYAILLQMFCREYTPLRML